jgi:hypothetical protein
VRLAIRLLALGATLVARAALAAGAATSGTTAVVSPPLNSAPRPVGGCTPLNPCAVVAPELGSIPDASAPAPVSDGTPQDVPSPSSQTFGQGRRGGGGQPPLTTP